MPLPPLPCTHAVPLRPPSSPSCCTKSPCYGKHMFVPCPSPLRPPPVSVALHAILMHIARPLHHIPHYSSSPAVPVELHAVPVLSRPQARRPPLVSVRPGRSTRARAHPAITIELYAVPVSPPLVSVRPHRPTRRPRA
jgi:hypothetical protein